MKWPPACCSGDTYATMLGTPTPVSSIWFVMVHPVMADPTSATVLFAKAACRAALLAASKLPVTLAGRRIPAAGRRNTMAAMARRGVGGVT